MAAVQCSDFFAKIPGAAVDIDSAGNVAFGVFGSGANVESNGLVIIAQAVEFLHTHVFQGRIAVLSRRGILAKRGDRQEQRQKSTKEAQGAWDAGDLEIRSHKHARLGSG